MADNVPEVTSIHHVALTVRDVEASAAWYERVLGLNRIPVPFPHHDREDTGYGVLMVSADMSVVIGLHHHESHGGDGFDEAHTGLDHLGIAVADRNAMDAWVAKLDAEGVEHSGIRDLTEPVPFSTLVFRDPDNIQLELYSN
ncbi:MAG: VOC family protein [Microthrixaceae bacterium]